MQPVTADPFAALYEPQTPPAEPSRPQTELYISGRLTLLRIPAGVCGEWTNLAFLTTHATWHRRLDTNAFLWLRSAVRRTIETGKLAPEFSDAEQRLDQIAAIAIVDGIFTADDIATHREAPEWYSFNAGLPTWADEIGRDFLPPVRRNAKPALTGGRS